MGEEYQNYWELPVTDNRKIFWIQLVVILNSISPEGSLSEADVNASLLEVEKLLRVAASCKEVFQYYSTKRKKKKLKSHSLFFSISFPQ